MGGNAEVILLDTHVLIWLASEPARVPQSRSDFLEIGVNSSYLLSRSSDAIRKQS